MRTAGGVSFGAHRGPSLFDDEGSQSIADKGRTKMSWHAYIHDRLIAGCRDVEQITPNRDTRPSDRVYESVPRSPSSCQMSRPQDDRNQEATVYLVRLCSILLRIIVLTPLGQPR